MEEEEILSKPSKLIEIDLPYHEYLGTGGNFNTKCISIGSCTKSSNVLVVGHGSGDIDIYESIEGEPYQAQMDPSIVCIQIGSLLDLDSNFLVAISTTGVIGIFNLSKIAAVNPALGSMKQAGSRKETMSLEDGSTYLTSFELSLDKDFDPNLEDQYLGNSQASSLIGLGPGGGILPSGAFLLGQSPYDTPTNSRRSSVKYRSRANTMVTDRSIYPDLSQIVQTNMTCMCIGELYTNIGTKVEVIYMGDNMGIVYAYSLVNTSATGNNNSQISGESSGDMSDHLIREKYQLNLVKHWEVDIPIVGLISLPIYNLKHRKPAKKRKLTGEDNVNTNDTLIMISLCNNKIIPFYASRESMDLREIENRMSTVSNQHLNVNSPQISLLNENLVSDITGKKIFKDLCFFFFSGEQNTKHILKASRPQVLQSNTYLKAEHPAVTGFELFQTETTETIEIPNTSSVPNTYEIILETIDSFDIPGRVVFAIATQIPLSTLNINSKVIEQDVLIIIMEEGNIYFYTKNNICFWYKYGENIKGGKIGKFSIDNSTHPQNCLFVFTFNQYIAIFYNLKLYIDEQNKCLLNLCRKINEDKIILPATESNSLAQDKALVNKMVKYLYYLQYTQKKE